MTKIREILDTQSTNTSEDITETFSDFGEELRRALQPIVQLQSLADSFKAPTIRVPTFDFGVQQILESHRRLAANLRYAIPRPFAEFSRKLEKFKRHNDLLDKSGWLPHHSTPFELVDACGSDSDALRRRLRDFYTEHWPGVRQQIELRLVGHELDDEAKATFREALDAHESGFYRCVCRLLPPEVERVARIELHDDRKKGISSQPKLRKLARTVRVSSIEPRGFRGLNLLRRLENHLYDNVPPDTGRNRFQQDPVPNRHAALHGLVAYSSMQHSLNSIFMTEYIFQVISALKKDERLQAAS